MAIENNPSPMIEQPHRTVGMGDLKPNLPLAIALHFNCYFSVTYGVLVGGTILHKLSSFRYSDRLHRSVLFPVFGAWAVAETARLYLGHTGNLHDRVPLLSAFLLITIFPQIPCIIYLSYYQELVFPVDSSAGSLMVAIIGLEVLLGCGALRSLIRRRTASFFESCRTEEGAAARDWEPEEEKERSIEDMWNDSDDESLCGDQTRRDLDANDENDLLGTVSNSGYVYDNLIGGFSDRDEMKTGFEKPFLISNHHEHKE